MSADEVRRSRIRNVITNALGRQDNFKIDLFDRTLKPGDIILLCSDGLYGVVEAAEFCQILANNPDLSHASRLMVELANRRGGPDNISVLLIQVKS